MIYIRMANTKAKFASMDLTASDLTPAMQQVIDRRAKRLASGTSDHILFISQSTLNFWYIYFLEKSSAYTSKICFTLLC